MKRNLCKILFLIMSLFVTICYVNVKAATNYEVLKDSVNGQTIYYKGTSTAVQIPTFYEEKETEFRGSWVSFFAGDLATFTTKEQMMSQLNDVLDHFEYFNMNTIVFHIRTHNDALYPTDLAPMSSYVKNCNFEEWDYLEWFIEQCHARGIEFHAWLNPYRIISANSYGEDQDPVEEAKAYITQKYANCEKNPAHDLNNVLISTGVGGAILNPGIPEVRDYIVDVCMEVIEKYDVDAIHFDDYFYISDVDDNAQKKLYGSGMSTADFRRSRVNLFIEQLSQEIYNYNVENNRAVQLGISPTGVYRNGSYVAPSAYKYDSNGNLTYPTYSGTGGYAHYDASLYCDTKKWIDNEWIDYICPQNYQSLDNPYAPHAAVSDWWNGVVAKKDCRLYMGIGQYKTTETADSNKGWKYNDEEFLMQLRYNANLENVDGVCIYQYKTLAKLKENADLKTLVAEYWTKPALNPIVIKYADNFTDSTNISNLKLYESATAYALSWDKNESVRRYAIYKTVNGVKTLIGFSGNSSKEFVSFTDPNKESNATYSVVPITCANSFGVEATVLSSNVSKLEYAIGKIDITVTAPTKLGGTYMVIFSNPEINFGDKGTYQIFVKEGTNSEWKEVVKSKEFTGTNSNRLTYSQNGLKTYIKVVCTNNMGVFESEIYQVQFSHTPDSILAFIFTKNNNLFEDILEE